MKSKYKMLINGTQLKVIAITCMTLDHMAEMIRSVPPD